MKRISVLIMVVAAALMVATVSAQGKPNFTGKWTIVVDPNAPPPGGAGGGRGGRGGMGGGRGGAVGGQTFTLTQDAATLKVERMQGETPYTLTYKLDGSESKNTTPGRQGGQGSESIAKATWEGSTLVINITQTMNMGGQSMNMQSKQVLSLAADGSLVVETTAAGMGGGEPMTTKVTYKKG